ncbi:hypothetical protein IRP62_13315 (plasmid) [Clostridium botulinum]|uniref:hypothetical protein n=1 Tax=Clostridium botulinum TaxID=1491 RepID=UPI0018DC07CB|nr:hypothetical protein [Clostridium botulinum]QPW54683.1 hypothetical protein IRP62_13315 [Clostridium botulinum]
MDNKELKEGNREIVLNHIYFFKVFSKKINVDISPDIKKKIHQFINEYYINNINNMKALNKFVLLDILEKLTFINESKDTRLNASILQMLEYCEKINLNIYLDKEVTSFYKLNILHNMNSKKLTIDLKYKISSIANNFLSNIDKKFIQSPENVAIINMAIVSLLKVDTKIVSKVRVEFINIIENSIDIPAILKFYYFDTLSKISKDTNIKKVIDTYPMDKDGICTSPAMLIPSFRTLYFFINIKNFDSILLNKYKSQQDIYIDQLFNKYTNKTVDLRESYYFLAMEKYLNSNSEFKNFKKKYCYFNKRIRLYKYGF